MPNHKGIHIREARTRTLIWMLWLIYFQCTKGRHTAQMPKSQHFFKLIIFQPTGQTNFSLPMRASSLLSSSVLDSVTILLLQIPELLLDPFLKASTMTELNHPLSLHLHPNSWAKLDKYLSTKQIYSHSPQLSPRQCPLILLLFSSSCFSILYLFQFLQTSHTHSQVMTCFQLHWDNQSN